MHEAKRVLSVAVVFVAVLAVLAGGVLWWNEWRGRPVPEAKNARVAEANVPPKGLTEDGFEEAVRPAATGPVELSPDVAKTHAEQVGSCRKVQVFIDRCVGGEISTTANPWAKIGGYSMPLPSLPAPAKGFALEPNPGVCSVAAEWGTYCRANVYR